MEERRWTSVKKSADSRALVAKAPARVAGWGGGSSRATRVHSKQGKQLYPVGCMHEFVPIKDRGKTNFGH